MRRWLSNILYIGAPLFAFTALSACGSSQLSNDELNNADQTIAVLQNETISTNVALAAAAENFETLTEQAFTANQNELVLLFVKAQESATGIAGQLTPAAAQELEGRVKEAKTAIDAGNAPDVALAAVEGYRLIVSAFPLDAQVPVAVNLLDYSGFRIQLDLKSDPIRWSDASEAARFAQKQWNLIKDSVTDFELNKRVSESLDMLDEYLSVKDDEMAMKAAENELNLVDKLEDYFQSTDTISATNIAVKGT